jgi:hypothetical protein
MLLLVRGRNSAAAREEGQRLLSAAHAKQSRIFAAAPENFDYQSYLKQTEDALNGSIPNQP